MVPPVLLPALLIGFRAEGLLLSVADDADAAGGDAIGHKRLLKRLGAALPERDVVLCRSALVAVPSDDQFHLGMLEQERGILFSYRRVLRTEIGLVVVEVDVMHVLLEELVFGQRRGRRRG